MEMITCLNMNEITKIKLILKKMIKLISSLKGSQNKFHFNRKWLLDLNVKFSTIKFKVDTKIFYMQNTTGIIFCQ